MATLAEQILQGDVRAASRLMRELDDQVPEAARELSALFPKTGRAYVVGITGSPGTGKSTLTSQLIGRNRALGRTVGVVAVDPTSPFTGGAILGDRVRMQSHATDPGVFIRSMATRGALGGLSRATGDVVRVLDAMGKDTVLVETVGVGQDEVEVVNCAHTVVVVLAPAMGDDVQAIKAGILEIADVFAVNKADQAGADRTVRELCAMLELRRGPALALADHDNRHRMLGAGKGAGQAVTEGWEPPVVKTVGTAGDGIEDLFKAVEAHREHLEKTGERAMRERRRARADLMALLRDRLLGSALERLEAEQGAVDEVVRRVAERQADPYVIADELAARLAASERR